MPQEKTLTARDAKLVQWLSEAYTKEVELESELNAHIALTEKMSYKKRLRKHLTETRDHKRRVAARIKKLGGTATNGIPVVPTTVGNVAGKAVAVVKGQVGAARAAVSPQAETHLRNVAGRASRGARRDRDLLADRGVRDRGRRPRDRTARQEHQARRGADGEVPRR